MDNRNAGAIPGGDGVVDGYNFAPFTVFPWTNWPDVYGDLFGYGPSFPWPPPAGGTQIALDANPLGNPGFGDTRWLRSTEPSRITLPTAGSQSQPQVEREFFTHWPHLSWIPTAENGWRVCIDISDLGSGSLIAAPRSLQPVDFFPSFPYADVPPAVDANINRWGLDVPYEQWLAFAPPALRWIQATGIDIGKLGSPVAPMTPECAAYWFRLLAFGNAVQPPLPPFQCDNTRDTRDFAGKPGGWFSPNHWSVMQQPQFVMPNFLQLKWFGPESDEFRCDSPRNIIARTLADADGDGFTDSFWFVAPASVDRSIKHVVAVSVVDNTGLLNVNVASRFDRANTVGSTPADVALVTRLQSANADLPVGFLNSPLNQQSASAVTSPIPPLGTPANGPPYPAVNVQFDLAKWGVNGNTGAATGSATDPTFLREVGVLRELQNGTAQPVPTAEESPFRLTMRTPVERTRYFKAMADGGRVGDYIDNQGRIHIAYGDAPQAFRLRTPQLTPFGIADEYELRARHGSNDPALLSRLERAVDSNNLRFLRSSPEREETSEYFDSLTNDQLLHDNRRKITTVNGARNELMPPWMWTLPPDEAPTRLIRLPRVRTEPAVDGEFARQSFIDWNRKLDLNEQFPADPVAFLIAQRRWLNRLANILQLSVVGQVAQMPQDTNVLSDRIFTLFGARAFPAGAEVGEPFAIRWSQRLAASWAANILAARDRPVTKRLTNGTEYDLDSPLAVGEALQVVFADPRPNELPTDADNKFIGQEPHPFIAQVFFAFVYPRSRVDDTGGLCQAMQADGILYPGETCGNAFRMPIGFEGAGEYFVNFAPGNPAVPVPAPVLVVQIINPYNCAVDLSRFSLLLTLGGTQYRFLFGLSPEPSAPTSGWDYGLNPILGPATEEGPRSAIVFACPKSLGGDDPNFRAKMMAFLDLTHPWFNPSYPDPTPVVGQNNWPSKLRQELASAQAQLGPQGINIFPIGVGAGLADLFEDEATPYADTLVFNASLEDRGPLGWPIDQSVYRNAFKSGIPPKIELVRVVGTVLPTPDGTFSGATDPIVVDRFVNEYGRSDQIVASERRWADLLRRISDPDPEDSRYVPPRPASGYLGGRRDYDAIRIGANGLWFSNWVRASRPWVWDVNQDGAITADERSPRFAIASALDVETAAVVPDSALSPILIIDDRKIPGLYGDVAREGSGPDGQGPDGQLFDPNNPTGNLWMVRPGYTNPLYQSIEGKPTNFTLRTVSVEPSAPGAERRVRVYPAFPIRPAQTGPWRQTSLPRPVPVLDAPIPAGYLPPNAPWPGTVGAAVRPSEFLGDTGVSVGSLQHAAHRFPWRLVHRDGNFEQIAEIFDVPVYGTVVNRSGQTTATFAEMMAGAPADDSLKVFPDMPVASMGRFALDPRSPAPNQTLAIGGPPGGSPPRVQQAFMPVLPFGSSIIDCLTFDAGGQRPDTGWGLDAATSEGAEMRLRQSVLAEERSPRLARGYSGQATPGLINLNTAPIEVLRALPNMTALSLNDEALGALMPTLSSGPGSVNPQAAWAPDSSLFGLPRTRLPETIVNYRDQTLTYPGPAYVDRGFVPPGYTTVERNAQTLEVSPFHPGMRRERGITSVGELGLMSRHIGWGIQDTPLPGSIPEPNPINAPAPESSDGLDYTNWSWNRSWSVDFAGADPFREDEGPPPPPTPTGHAGTVTPPSPTPPAGSGYTAPGAGGGSVNVGLAARLSTDRHPTVIRRDNRATPVDETLLELPMAAGDQVEKNLLLKGVANLVTTRSDVFTVYVKIRSVAQNPGSGKWDATDPKHVIEDTRWVMVVDRSRVDRPGDEPEILMMQRVP